MECGAETEWVKVPLEGKVHTWTICHYGSEVFLPQCPFILVLVEFKGFGTLFLSRLVTMNVDEAAKYDKLELARIYEKQVKVGMPIKAQFLRNSKFLPTDVYFVPA